MTKKELEDKILKEFDKKYKYIWHSDMDSGIEFAEQTKKWLVAFLTETIQQSMEVGREEERNRIINIIEKYTTPAHPHVHSMRWLKLDSETLNEMMKVINSPKI